MISQNVSDCRFPSHKELNNYVVGKIIQHDNWFQCTEAPYKRMKNANIKIILELSQSQ